MKTIRIVPDQIAAFGEDDATIFYLVTNSKWMNTFTLHSEGRYNCLEIIIYDGDVPFVDLLQDGAIREQSHVLTILPECLLHSVPRNLMGQRKLLIMACRSGKTDLDGVEHFLECGIKADPLKLQEFADNFFSAGESAQYFKLKSTAADAVLNECVFNHLNDDYEWHEQTGTLSWGDQQVFPAGEIACFLVPLYTDQLPDRRFDLNGSVVMTGPVIVQSGPPSFKEEDQLRIYEILSSMKQGVRAVVDNGLIVRLESISPEDEKAKAMLETLFRVDSRYAHIYEVGFSINDEISPWPGNSAMNEVWGENGGKLHLGLGMLPYTQYHLDIFCSTTHVVDHNEAVVFGKRQMARSRSSGCPCMTDI